MFEIPTDGLTQKDSLLDLPGSYVLFTHALLMTRGRCPFDPLAMYVEQAKEDPSIGVMRLDQPLFRGFETWEEEWTRALFFCPQPNWMALSKYLSEIALVDRDRGTFAKVEWSVAFASGRSSTLLGRMGLGSPPPGSQSGDVIPISILDVDASYGFYTLEPKAGEPAALLTVHRRSARDTTLRYAMQLLMSKEL